MTIFWQILEKRRWLAAFGVCVILCAGVYFGSNLWQTENFAALQAGISDLQNANFDGFSPTAVFFLLITATLISEDLTCIAAGVLASQGRISLAAAIAACAVGIFIGDSLTFFAGRILGRRALKWKITSYFLSEKAVERSSHWLERRGMKTVFISRFVFGLRLPLYFGAGVLKTSFWRFALYFSLAVVVWTPIVVGLTYKIGAEAVKMSLFNQNFLLGVILFVAAVYIFFRIVQQLLTWKGRRLLWGKIKRRFTREFRSARVFYLPLAVYIPYLAIKHRGLMIFTCANPAFFAGGFVAESKAKILNGLCRSKAAEPVLLRHLFLPADLPFDEKRQKASQFMAENELSLPVVLKPDIGACGRGVEIIKTHEALFEKLAQNETQILQEFASGNEASVFYYRSPNAEKGKIFAITEKRFPCVTGDGVSTLEELILRDARTVCLADKYFEANAERLDEIPANGESIQLTEIGNHSRGAIYLDGERVKSVALERKIDEISRGYKGFYFGRFDLRIGSFDELKAGEGFKIIELNGVANDMTKFYDPKISLLDAYKTLFRQWKIAFEIGAENHKRGCTPTKLTDLTKLFFLGGQIQNPKSEIQN